MKLSNKEAVEILRKISTPVRPIYCGNQTVVVDGHTVIIFIDCGELDYVDRIDETDFDDWDVNPVDLLTKKEFIKLETLLTEGDFYESF